MTHKLARKLAAKSCESERKACIIHPFLPMMKLSYGTVETVSRFAENSDDSTIVVMAELSPFHKGKRDKPTFLEDLTITIIEEGLSEENCLSYLEDTQ